MQLQCSRGHLVEANQKFCPECGESVSSPSSTWADVTDIDDEVPPPRSGRPAWIVPVAAVALILLVVICAGLLGRSDHSDDDAADQTEEPTTTVDTSPSKDECIGDTAAFLNAASHANNAGDAGYLFRAYGAQDPRTNELLKIFTDFQSNLYSVGEEQANWVAHDQLERYCAAYGEAPPIQ